MVRCASLVASGGLFAIYCRALACTSFLNRMSKSCYFYLAVVTLGARRASFSEAIPFPFIA
ncbi:hypothetical protein EXIGLDRAFT_726168 [Exidia glandulosa HHB12029]|uniref:Uncharacterized protein n=1 Tax=Exidia glandulosa HHB12029 TaxID=1314781 RepID=A0A165ZS60_EXIGL|nr:hypothetical protein EXIGLDRAFT_726168 [Exidia glandulosa HHB12029]